MVATSVRLRALKLEVMSFFFVMFYLYVFKSLSQNGTIQSHVIQFLFLIKFHSVSCRLYFSIFWGPRFPLSCILNRLNENSKKKLRACLGKNI